MSQPPPPSPLFLPGVSSFLFTSSVYLKRPPRATLVNATNKIRRILKVQWHVCKSRVYLIFGFLNTPEWQSLLLGKYQSMLNKQWSKIKIWLLIQTTKVLEIKALRKYSKRSTITYSQYPQELSFKLWHKIQLVHKSSTSLSQRKSAALQIVFPKEPLKQHSSVPKRAYYHRDFLPPAPTGTALGSNYGRARSAHRPIYSNDQLLSASH